MAESEYGGLGLSIVVVVKRYVILKTKVKGRRPIRGEIIVRQDCTETDELLLLR